MDYFHRSSNRIRRETVLTREYNTDSESVELAKALSKTYSHPVANIFGQIFCTIDAFAEITRLAGLIIDSWVFLKGEMTAHPKANSEKPNMTILWSLSRE